MTNQISISIVIVNWNGLKWLDRLFSSLADQSYQSSEIIVVDNNSTDGSLDYIYTKHPYVKVIKSGNNIGFAGGNNIGIAHACGEYILLLNTDTWLKNDLLKNLFAHIKSTGDDVVAPREASYYSGKAPAQYVSAIDILGHPIYLYGNKFSRKHDFFLSGVCLLFKKDLYYETRGLDNNFFMYFEEIDWFWRLNLVNKTFSFCPDTYVYHAGSGSSVNKRLKYNSFLWRNQNTLQTLLKNYSFHNLLWVLPLYFIQNMCEALALLLLGKPRLSLSYVQGWIFNLINLPRILKQRRYVQRMRLVSDREIIKRMHKGPAKIRHALQFVSILDSESKA